MSDKPLDRPHHHFTTPTVMVIKQTDTHYEGKGRSLRQVPLQRVPVDQRTGWLRIVWARQLRAYGYVSTKRSYPDGLYVEPRRVVEMYLEVLPRGRTKAEYESMARGSMRTVTMGRPRLDLSGRTPLLMSSEAAVQYGGWAGGTDGYVSFIRGNELQPLVVRLLPWLGVEPTEVDNIARRLVGQLPAGIQRLSEREAEIERRR